MAALCFGRCQGFTAPLASRCLMAKDGAPSCFSTPDAPASALHPGWIAPEISKYRPFLLKLSQVPGLRRAAARWASSLKFQVNALSPSHRLSPTQDYVAAPYLLIRSPFAYIIRLQLRSLHLRRATSILKSLCQHHPTDSSGSRRSGPPRYQRSYWQDSPFPGCVL